MFQLVYKVAKNWCLSTLLLAGTYIRVEKTEHDHNFQSKSYCEQKKYNLVKPMMVVATDGYIVGVIGPYLGHNNDASILGDSLKRSDGKNLLNLLGDGGVCVLDRGFLKAVTFLNQLGLTAHLPAFLRNAQQFDTKTANLTRLVTKVRWVVESVNSRVKRWKYFARTIPHQSYKFLQSD